ncbi:MAG: PASTA domain-containing protein [Bacteroidota bacterium]
MSLLRFIKSKVFFRQLGLSILVTIILLWVTLRLLDIYTRHGQSIDVPDFKGKNISELDDFATDNSLDYLIIDSLYDYNLPRGTVALQDPAPGSKVKKGRKVYLTVVALNPERVSMPNLLDLTLRQASAVLETYGLKVGKLTYVPDIAHNAVLKQKYLGQVIKEGVLLDKGSKIDLVLGQGENSGNASVPDLIGKSQIQALRLLQGASLNLGSEVFEDGNDTSRVRIYKQQPAAGSSASFGGQVDLWYKSVNKKKTN